jgi:4-aminobutyrate aminotransferase/(S)-3-amino-2-methylpropionate transaminase
MAATRCACAAALAAMETIEADNLVTRAGEIERIMLTRLHRMQADDSRIGEVRGRGAMIAIELVQQDSSEPDPTLAAGVASAARKQGVIVLTVRYLRECAALLAPSGHQRRAAERRSRRAG